MSEEPRKQVVGYVRVSVDNEAKVSPEMQTEAIETQCKLKGWDLVDMIVERGKSAGEGKKRAGLDRVRKMIRTGKASGLVVWKIDRCSRSVRDFAEIISELRKYDADFVSVTESFDTSNAIGRAMLQITMVFAELERERSSERITAWHDYRRRQGKPVGDAAMPLGYYRQKEIVNGVEKSVGPFLVDEAAAAVVKGTIAVYLESGSTQTAQQYLAANGYPRDLTATKGLLRASMLTGMRTVDGQPVPGEWPAIIDWETHQAALAQLARTSHGKRGRPKSPRWMLTSIATCGRCGRPMHASRVGNPVRLQYRCNSAGTAYKGVGARCFLTIFREHLEGYVEDQVLGRISPEQWQRMRERRQATPLPPLVDTVGLEARLTELAEDYASERITKPEWDAARQVMLTRLAAADAENAMLVADDDDEDAADLPDVADLHRAWRADRLSTEQKRLIITAVVDNVVVRPGFLIPGRKNGWAPVEDRVDIEWRTSQVNPDAEARRRRRGGRPSRKPDR